MNRSELCPCGLPWRYCLRRREFEFVFALVLVLLAAQPADAHCYSRWYYPWPQSCKTSTAHTLRRTWFVDVTPAISAPTPAPVDDDTARRDAIEQLRHELQAINRN